MGRAEGAKPQKSRRESLFSRRIFQATLLLMVLHFIFLRSSCRWDSVLHSNCILKRGDQGHDWRITQSWAEAIESHSLRERVDNFRQNVLQSQTNSKEQLGKATAQSSIDPFESFAKRVNSVATNRTLENLPSTIRKAPRFVFYRIIGNDMPPLQSVGQLRKNTEYLLEFESAFPDCEKRWVLNRVANLTEKILLRSLLEQHGYTSEQILDIPFDVDSLLVPSEGKNVTLNHILSHCKTPEDELQQLGRRIRDVVGLNSGRNAALDHGLRSGARWVLLFDANQFLPLFSWAQIRKLADEADQFEHVRYIEVPMVRLRQEQDPSWLNPYTRIKDMIFHSEGRMEEGQLIFRNDSTERFNENMAYALAPKQDLLDRTCSFNSTTCLCHDTVWWWKLKTTRAMLKRIRPCGVSVRLWSYPDPEALMIKDGNARRDLRIKSAKRFVQYVDGLVAARRRELQEASN